MKNKKIPKIEMPSIPNYKIIGVEEQIVSVKESGILVSSQYYKDGIAGSYKDCYLREGVLQKLIEAERKLPKGLKLKVLDGYRPICIQQKLWNFYRQEIKNKNPGLSEDELDFKTSFFVSKPSLDVFKPSLHNTGGSVDLTLVTNDGYELNMGTLFDDFTERAWSNHFEEYENNEEVKQNRRILYNAMIDSGFTNLPSEWWHYDYGTKFWGFFTNQDALYYGVLDMDFPERFPNI